MAYITKLEAYRAAGITSAELQNGDTDMDGFIANAERYTERRLGTEFESTQVTETYSGDDTDILFLDHYPIVTLDTLTVDGTSVTTSKVYLFLNEGKIQLKTSAEKTKFPGNLPQLTSVTYTYFETPDEAVKRFTAIVAAQMALSHQIGGTFDDVTSYQLPELAASKGEPFTNIRESLIRLRDEAQRMLDQGVVYIKPQFA